MSILSGIFLGAADDYPQMRGSGWRLRLSTARQNRIVKAHQPAWMKVYETALKTTTPAPTEYDPGCEALYLRHGIDPRGMKKLGSGVYGTAYLLKDGRVLKTTSDSDEIRLGAWLMEQQASGNVPTIFPRVDAAFRALCGGTPQQAMYEWQIVREDIEGVETLPAPIQKLIEDEIYPPLWHLMREIKNSNWARILADREENAKNFKIRVLAFFRKLDEIERRIRSKEIRGLPQTTWTRNIRESLEWCIKHGAFVTDVRSPNLGFRPGTKDLVIRDLGFSDALNIDPHAELPTLAGLRRR